jgi:drug/metabolite transporter (DMT)-like permease
MISRARLRASWAQAPGPIRAAVLMTIGAFTFTIMAGAVRHLAPRLHPFELAFFRNFFSLLFMAPWIIHGGWAGLRTSSWRKYGLRGIISIVAMLCWFYGMATMPIAEATALTFTAPIFASIGAILFLGETMGARRWCAIAVGFLGAMIILRPGLATVSWSALIVLFGSAAIAGAIIMVKILSRTEPSSLIVTYMGFYLVPMSLLPAVFVWEMPSGMDWPWLIVIGASATIGQLAITHAYAAADATVVLPFDYARLPFAAIIGYVAFSETPDFWTWIGAAVIASSAVYIARREARLSMVKASAAKSVETTLAGSRS